MLTLVTPNLDDLWFRQELMTDEDTMSYNAKWGGTISFLKKNGSRGMILGLEILKIKDFIATS